MSTKPPVHTDEGEVIRLAIHILQTHGWVCLPPKDAPGHMLTPQDVAKRCDLRANTLHRRIYSASCPAFYAEYGSTGRILRIKFTPELEAYLRRPVKRRIHRDKPRQSPPPQVTPPRKSRRQAAH